MTQYKEMTKEELKDWRLHYVYEIAIIDKLLEVKKSE